MRARLNALRAHSHESRAHLDALHARRQALEIQASIAHQAEERAAYDFPEEYTACQHNDDERKTGENNDVTEYVRGIVVGCRSIDAEIEQVNEALQQLQVQFEVLQDEVVQNSQCVLGQQQTGTYIPLGEAAVSSLAEDMDHMFEGFASLHLSATEEEKQMQKVSKLRESLRVRIKGFGAAGSRVDENGLRRTSREVQPTNFYGRNNVSSSGNSDVPTGGSTAVPNVGPTTVPTGGPTTVPTGGPNTVPNGGPQRGGRTKRKKGKSKKNKRHKRKRRPFDSCATLETAVTGVALMVLLQIVGAVLLLSFQGMNDITQTQCNMPTPQYMRHSSPVRLQYGLPRSDGWRPAYGLGSGRTTVGMHPNRVMNVHDHPVFMRLLLYANANFRPNGHPDFNHISVVMYFGSDFCLHCMRGARRNTHTCRGSQIGTHRNYSRSDGERNTQGENTRVVTFNVGNSRTFTLYAEDGEEIVTTFDLRQGIVNVLDPRDEAVDRMYRHGAQMHGHGVSIGFVVRHVPHYRQFDSETDEMVLNENERAYEDGCQKLNDKQNLVEGGSFYQQFFHHPRCDQRNCRCCSRIPRHTYMDRMRQYWNRAQLALRRNLHQRFMELLRVDGHWDHVLPELRTDGRWNSMWEQLNPGVQPPWMEDTDTDESDDNETDDDESDDDESDDDESDELDPYFRIV